MNCFQTFRDSHTASLLLTDATRSKPILAAGVALWLAAPIAALVLLGLIASQQTLADPVEHVWVEVREVEGSASSPVDLALTWGAPDPLRAPKWDGGLIQSVLVSPGEQITDASEIARINGVLVLGVVSPEPFYRTIARDDRGEDVRALNNFLSRSGFAVVEGDVATAKTVAGIRSLAERIGLQNVSTFEPDWVVHMPVDSYSIGAIELKEGTPAPALGVPIITAAVELTSATIVPPGTFPSTSDTGNPAPDPREIDRRAMAIAPNQRIFLGQHEILLDESRTKPDAASLSVIASAVASTATAVQANQVRSAVAGDVVVPSAAVFANAGGQTCILLQSTDRAVLIELVADVGGSSIVRGNVDVGDRVEVRVMGARRECG